MRCAAPLGLRVINNSRVESNKEEVDGTSQKLEGLEADVPILQVRKHLPEPQRNKAGSTVKSINDSNEINQ